MELDASSKQVKATDGVLLAWQIGIASILIIVKLGISTTNVKVRTKILLAWQAITASPLLEHPTMAILFLG